MVVFQVVVKPFGPTWNSCKGVTYHATEDIDSIMEAVFDLLNQVESGTGILLQSFIYTLEPVVTFGLGRHAVNTERKCGFSPLLVFNPHTSSLISDQTVLGG